MEGITAAIRAGRLSFAMAPEESTTEDELEIVPCWRVASPAGSWTWLG
jgi:hypothetical protein